MFARHHEISCAVELKGFTTGCVPIIMVDRIHISMDLPFPSLIDWDKIALFTHSLGDVRKHDGGLQRMARVIEGVVGKVSPSFRCDLPISFSAFRCILVAMIGNLDSACSTQGRNRSQ